MMNELSVGAIAGTAVALGVVHVLSGADHLSAVVTLSANVPYKQAFFLGVRWGLGHSFGLLVIGTVFIAITASSSSDTVEIPHAVEKVFESLVGVFMLLLGAYGMRRAWLKRRHERNARSAKEPDEEEEAVGDTEAPALPPQTPLLLPDETEVEGGAVCGVEVSYRDEDGATESHPPVVTGLARGGFSSSTTADTDAAADEELGVRVVDLAPQLPPEEADKESKEEGSAVAVPVDRDEPADPRSMEPKEDEKQEDAEQQATLPHDHDDTVRLCRSCSCFGLSERISAGWIALLMGMVHGLAGPGGVLGVIPAVQLHDWRLAFLYLGIFCVSSTFIMGVFALVYGALSSRIGGSASRREFWIEFLSACLSLVVGIIWLVLIPLDKLDDVFG